PLGRPVSRAARLSGIAAPGATAGIAREPARAGGKFILDGYGSANRSRARHTAPEPDEVRMRDYSVSNVDGEVIGRIARASLRDENEVPRSVVGRAGLRDGGEGNKEARDNSGKQKALHHDFLRSIVGVAADIW